MPLRSGGYDRTRCRHLIEARSRLLSISPIVTFLFAIDRKSPLVLRVRRSAVLI